MMRYLERHLASSDQHVKELMHCVKGLHERMQCTLLNVTGCMNIQEDTHQGKNLLG